jgi:hypothetical protein
MQRVTSQPLKMPTPWASGAGAGFIRPVPNASQIHVTPGAASFSDGFPPLTFTPVAAGGVPPFGADMNGVLNQVTAWERWQQAGGPIRYDPTFQGAIGGYPAEARVGSNTVPNLIWQSTADNNLTNPDAGGGGWQTPQFPDPNVAGLTVTAAVGLGTTAASAGAGIAFVGNGTATPKKWLRAVNGNLSVVNNAYTAEIFTLSDVGDVSNVRNLTAGGTVSASIVTATNGATVGGAASVGSLHVTATPTTALIAGNALQVDGHANVNGQIVAGQGIYAGSFFSPNADRGREWSFQVDPSAGHKFQFYRSHWYDFWNGSNGTRSWVGAAGGGEQTLMSLDPVGNFSVTGQILTPAAMYAGTYFSPNDFNGREWSFQVDRVNNGHKYQVYRVGGWYDLWNGLNGTRSWATPSGNAMVLDGVGNLSIAHAFVAESARLSVGATGTGDGTRVLNLNDFPLNGSYQRFPDGLIIQWLSIGVPTQQTSVWNFPIAFPNACFVVVGSFGYNVSTTSPSSLGISQINNAQFGATLTTPFFTPPFACFVIAIGF